MSLCCNYFVTILARHVQNIIQFTKFLIMGMLQIKQYIPNKLASRIYSLDKSKNIRFYGMNFTSSVQTKKHISLLSQHHNANHHSASRQSLFHSLVLYEFHGDLLLSILWLNGADCISDSEYYEMHPHSILQGVPFSRGIVFVQQKVHATLFSDLPSDKPSRIREIRWMAPSITMLAELL